MLGHADALADDLVARIGSAVLVPLVEVFDQLQGDLEIHGEITPAIDLPEPGEGLCSELLAAHDRAS
jgi:hypothetical protein